MEVFVVRSIVVLTLQWAVLDCLDLFNLLLQRYDHLKHYSYFFVDNELKVATMIWGEYYKVIMFNILPQH